jgi:hypothetical protein
VAARHQSVWVLSLYRPLTPGDGDRSDLPHMPEPGDMSWPGDVATIGASPTTRIGSGSIVFGYGPNVLPNIFGD